MGRAIIQQMRCLSIKSFFDFSLCGLQFFFFLVALSSLIVRNAVQLKFPPKKRVGLMISRQNAKYSTQLFLV